MELSRRVGFRVIPGLGARIIPVDKKARNELQVRKGDEKKTIDATISVAEFHGIDAKTLTSDVNLAEVLQDSARSMVDMSEAELDAIERGLIPAGAVGEGGGQP